MADPNSNAPSPAGRRRRRKERNERRRRRAIPLILFASLVGAAVFAPDLVQLVRKGQPGVRQMQRPVRTVRPQALHKWRFDFSMGPILELLEQGIRLDPFDLRRPLRIPFTIRPRTGGPDILLFEPAGYLPPLVPSTLSSLPRLPGVGSPQLPGWPGWQPPGGGIPTGEPDFDRELTISDDPLDPEGEPPDPIVPQSEPEPVPEAQIAWLLAGGLLAVLAPRARRRR